MKKTSFSLLVALLSFVSCYGQRVNAEWQRCMLDAVYSFPQGGGYYTGGKPNADFPKTTWQGLRDAFQMSATDTRPVYVPELAQPSFCSSATYGALVTALLMWDKKGKISREAWINMTPCVGIASDTNPNAFGQDDGVGFWGRANANGPALAVLVNELDAGFSFTAFRGAMIERNRETPDERYLTDDEWRSHPIWSEAVPGDIMKIFWDNNATKGRDSGAIVGYNGVKGEDQEAGHSVIFMGIDSQGQVMYWSSNGPGKVPKEMGYSIGACDKTRIQRVVFTRITRPERFDRVRHIAIDNVNQYLFDLNGKRHSSTAEVEKMIGAVTIKNK